jgi:hypothetical protein
VGILMVRIPLRTRSDQARQLGRLLIHRMNCPMSSATEDETNRNRADSRYEYLTGYAHSSGKSTVTFP